MLTLSRFVQVTCLSLGISSNAFAQSVTSLSQLVQQQDYQEAYDLSQQLVNENIGDPLFDYLLGRAAYHTEHFQEAVFAFERVVLNEPQNLSARTFLAFSYFKVKNYDAATVELTKLLPQPMPEQDRQQIQSYLAQIDKVKVRIRQQQSFRLEARYGHDSNVNSGSSLDKVTIPILGEIELFGNSRKISDNYRFYRANYHYQQKLTQRDSIGLGLDISHQDHDKAKFLNRTIPSLSLNYSRVEQDISYQLTSYVQPMELDGDYYRIAYGAIGAIHMPVNKVWQWQVSAGLSDVDNKQTDTQDLTQFSLTNKFFSQGQNKHLFEFSYGLDRAALEQAKHLSKNYTLARYSYLYQLSQQHQLSFALSYLDSQYKAVNPTLGIQRHDKLWSSELGYTYQLTPAWAINLLARYSDKKSNTDLYRYNRNEALLTLSYTQL